MPPDPSLFLSPLPPTGPVPGGDVPGERPDDEPDEHGPGGGASRPWRRAVAPLVVAALVLGAVVANRAGDGGDPRAQRTPTTSRTASTAPTTPTSTAPTTPTTSLGRALTTVEQRGPLLPEATGTTVVLATSERLVVVELDTGTVRMAGAPGLAVWGGAPFASVLPVGTAVLVGGAEPHLVERGEAGGALDAGGAMPGGLLPSAEPGRWWAVDHRFNIELVEHDVTGETGRRLSLPGDSSAVLPFGDGFLVSPAGSVLAVDATTGRARRITDGTAVAVDERTLVRTRCDEVLECGLVLSDHGGGSERLVGTPTPRSRYEIYAGARFSPDGRWLVVPFYGEDQPGGLVLVDVERGERRALDSLATAAGGGFAVTAAFTADSRWLLYGDPGDEEAPIRAVRIEDGASAEIDLGLGGGRSRGGATMVALPSVPGDGG